MGAAIAAVTVPDDRYSFSEGSKYRVIGTVAISASPATYTTGGIAMDLFVPLIKASRTPIVVYVQGQSGYIYEYVPGSDASQGLLKILAQGAASQDPLAELTSNEDIPAAVSGDTITFDALFFGME